MTVAPQIQQLLARLPEEAQLNFVTFWEGIYAIRYTGPITVHCFNGVARQVDLGAPIRLSIVEGLDKHPASGRR